MMRNTLTILTALAAFAASALLLPSCGSKAELANAALFLPDTTVYNREWQTARLALATDTEEVWVKGRGHSTFAQPKHPYALKLHQPLPLCGLPARRHWVLLANFFDHSLLRNALAMEVARQTSLKEVTPQGRFITLKTNGEWQGIYWLCERVKDKVSPTDSLLQLDVYHWEAQRKRGLPIDTLPAAPIDTLSFIDWWLVHELCMNAEPNGPRSCFVRITADGKAMAGPVWDFDMAFNEVGVDNGGDLRPLKFKSMHSLPPFLKGKSIRWLSVDSFYCDRSPIMARLLADKAFRHAAQKRWHELRPSFNRLTRRMETWSRLIRPSAPSDQDKWNAREPARFDASATWKEAVEKLKRTYEQRLKALDRLFESLTSFTSSS